MVDRNIYLKRMWRFVVSLYTSAFSALGWVIAGDLSTNKYIWWVGIPIILTITIVNSIMAQAWIFENK